MLHRLRRGARERRRTRQRGAVAVEAALLTPLLVLFVLGIIEFSLLLRDYVSVTSATRSGARIASANAGAGAQKCDLGPPAETGTQCADPSAPQLAKLAANAIQTQGSALNKDAINYMLIYKSNDKGFPGTLTAWSSDPVADCRTAGACVEYVWVKASDKFKYVPGNGSWTSTTINACVSNSDSVGVYLNATHPYVTKMFGTSKTISDRTIMRFEPLTATVCGSGKHP
jgi:Flp pilus assembly protein TadG